MDQESKKSVLDLAAVTVTIAECGGWAPKSPVFLALGCDMARLERVEALGKKLGWLEVTAEMIRLTDIGKDRAAALVQAGI